jgi:hypothetical protein
VSAVGLDDWDAMALIEQRRVLSTALPRNKNLPHTWWMNHLALSSNRGAFNSCVAYCFLAAPYWIATLRYGACFCLQCVGIVSKLSFRNLALKGKPGVCVVLIQCYPDASCACPIARKFVVFLECIFEMLGMFFADIFYAEVLNNQCELYWYGVMFPKVRYQFALLVTVFVCVFLASGYGWVTVMHEIPISSAQPVDIPSIP